jgi:metal-responsive CopG/Arc/MetJ family transcriptional regulator
MRTHVVMPKELVEEIDAEVGPRKRSQFVKEAVEEKLARRRRVAAFEAVAGSLADVDIPGWETSESTARWVRAQRRGYGPLYPCPPHPDEP